MHATPALGGVSPIGVRLTPRLVGIGRRGHVALTFDDGPDPASTPAILGVLDELGWSATFFMLGEMVRRAPGLARDVADAGHEIAVHGDVH
ncbi:MAG: polysaccharide deacetylase family protein, partial [Acidimicrobiia bacterium]